MAKVSARKRRRVKLTGKKLNYMVRGIDGVMWKAAKKKAAEEGRNMRWVIINLLWLYANHEIDFSKI
jgi:hypothetical protein